MMYLALFAKLSIIAASATAVVRASAEIVGSILATDSSERVSRKSINSLGYVSNINKRNYKI